MASSAVGIVTLLLVYVVAAAVVIASIEARNGGGGGGGRSVGGRQYFTPRRNLEGRGQSETELRLVTFKSWFMINCDSSSVLLKVST